VLFRPLPLHHTFAQGESQGVYLALVSHGGGVGVQPNYIHSLGAFGGFLKGELHLFPLAVLGLREETEYSQVSLSQVQEGKTTLLVLRLQVRTYPHSSAQDR